jgi:hypothetical protein
MDLDTSWIEKEEKINSIQQHYVRELPEKINLYYVYIDTNDSIEKVEKETEVLIDSKISKERLLQIIQTKRMPQMIHTDVSVGNKPTKYKLFDILAFQVHLDPEKIFSFSKNENEDLDSQAFLQSIPLFDEITVIPSIFIFHEINGIYFFFKASSSPPLRSILRNDGSKKENRVTKKVRIALETEDVPSHPKTLKNRPELTKHTRKNKSVLQ